MPARLKGGIGPLEQHLAKVSDKLAVVKHGTGPDVPSEKIWASVPEPFFQPLGAMDMWCVLWVSLHDALDNGRLLNPSCI